jgi:cytochrome c peroxidase
VNLSFARLVPIVAASLAAIATAAAGAAVQLPAIQPAPLPAKAPAPVPTPVKPPAPAPAPTPVKAPVPAPAPAPSATPGIDEYLSINIAAPANYAKPSLPAFYDAQVLNGVNTTPGNPITDKGATLGRVLFHDKRLSVNNTTACASCHQQGQSFGTATRFSKGFLGVSGTAHAMGLSHVAFYRGNAMFWDKRAPTLEAQATQPIRNSIEMGYDNANGGINALLVKMQGLPYYRELFSAVFGDATITEDRIQRALAQFERSMVSAGSRWELGYAKTYNAALPDKGLSLDVPGLTAQENAGRRLFTLDPRAGGAGCAGCHEPPTFALKPGSKSNGLDAGETRIFKSPSLKALSPGQPMMHDGRFTTYEQVVAHYNLGVQNGPALDDRLKTPTGQPRVPNLPAADLAALVAFLKTLDDPTLRTDARFSNPFKK